MSIVNVAVVEPMRALVAVDTAAAVIDPATGKTTKRFAAEKAGVHGGIVAACRGNLDIVSIYLANLRLCRQRVPFDVLLRSLPEQLAIVQRQFKQQAGDAPVPAMMAGTEFVLAGLDETKGRIRAVVATNTTDEGEAWKIEEIHGCMWAPGVFTPDDAPCIDSPDAMKTAAQRQVQAFRAVHPDAPIGGDLIVYCLGRGRVDILNMGGIGC